MRENEKKKPFEKVIQNQKSSADYTEFGSGDVINVNEQVDLNAEEVISLKS